MPPERSRRTPRARRSAAVAAAAAAARADAGEVNEEDEPPPRARWRATGTPRDENPRAKRVADPAYADVLARLVEETDFLVDAKARRTLDAAAEEARAAEDPAEAEEAAVRGGGARR